jgi:hypothetical protein
MAQPDPSGAIIDAEEDLSHGVKLGHLGRIFNPTRGRGGLTPFAAGVRLSACPRTSA